MSLLRSIETRIARLVEGTFGKVFRTSVQPVELARRLVKEMDEHQQRTVRNVYVPNRYDVFLSREDHRQLSPYAAALTSELSEYLAEHARRNAYALLTRPRVQLHLDRDLAIGRFGIAVKMEQTSELDAEIAADAADAQAPAAASAPTPAVPLDLEPLVGPTPAAAIAASDALTPDLPHHDEPMPTTAMPAAGSPTPATATEYGVFGDSGPFLLPTGARRVRVGRGRANDIVLQDASVSRDHGEFVATGGGWSVRDLGSTNGVSVNGAKVSEQSLEPGDVVHFGSAELRFDTWADGET